MLLSTYSVDSHRLHCSSSNIEPTLGVVSKARVVFMGTPEVASTSLRTIVQESYRDESSFRVIHVISQPSKRRDGRKEIFFNPVAKVAKELSIPILFPDKIGNSEFLEHMRNQIKPDLCITAAYGQYLPKKFLSIPKFGTLNIHPSLLPRWRGASPVQRSLQAGDDIVGVSVLFTVQRMDAGPIISQRSYKSSGNDTACTLLPYLFNIGTTCLIEAIPDVIAGKITIDKAEVQNENDVVYARKIYSLEGQIRVWEDSSVNIHNKVRGFSIWPGAFMYFQVGVCSSELIRVKLIKTKVLDNKTKNLTQEILLGRNKDDGLRVVCGDGSILEIILIQPDTRKVMDAKSYWNGLHGKTLRWVKHY